MGRGDEVVEGDYFKEMKGAKAKKGLCKVIELFVHFLKHSILHFFLELFESTF